MSSSVLLRPPLIITASCLEQLNKSPPQSRILQAAMRLKRLSSNQRRCIAPCDLCHFIDSFQLNCGHQICQRCVHNLVPSQSLSVLCPRCDQLNVLPNEIWHKQVVKSPAFSPTKLQQPVLYSPISRKSRIMLRRSADTGDNNSDVSSIPSDPGGPSNRPQRLTSHKRETHSVSFHEDSIPLFETPQACREHPGEELAYYCQTCHVSLCPSCPHNTSHPLVSISDAKTQLTTSPAVLQDTVRDKIAELRERLQRVYRVSEQVQKSSLNASNHVQDCFATIAKLLQERRNDLSTKLAESTDLQQKKIFDEKKDLEAIIQNLESKERLLQTGQDKDEIVKNLVEDLEKVANLQRIALLNPSESVTRPSNQEMFTFQPTYLASVEDMISKLGSLLKASEIATSIHVQGEGLKYSCIGRKTTITMYTRNDHTELINVDLVHLAGDIASHYGTKIDSLTIDNVGPGMYTLSYILKREGLYKLSITVYGTHITGSPFQLRCIGEEYYASSDSCSVHSKHRRTPASSMCSGSRSRSPASSRKSFTPLDDDLVLKVGKHGRGKSGFINVQDVACLSDGSVIVTDSNTQTVQLFSQDGDHRATFGSRGRLPGQFQRPVGVCVNQKNQILIADYETKWVSVFNQQGTYVSRMGVGKLLGPKGIAVNRAGQVIVVDNKASSILVFNANGKFVRKFGNRGTQECNLAGPHFVAVDDQNRLFISDFHNHCIKVFTIAGEFLYSFGSNGEGNGQFNAPTGITIDLQQHILCADWGNNRIQIFDADGSFLTFVNSSGEGIYGPQGLDIASENHVVVADSGNHCWKVYRYMT